MLASSKISRNGQTTLPPAVLDALGLKPGDRLVYEIENGSVVLRAKTGQLADIKDRFLGFGSKWTYPVSVEKMHEAVISAGSEKTNPRKNVVNDPDESR
jgi:AbrB family looped-hinge helix DNA binding protein